MFHSKISRQVCLLVAIFILCSEGIILFYSIKTQRLKLAAIETHIQSKLKERGIFHPQAILDQEYIESEIEKFKENIYALVAIIVVVVTAGVGMIFQLTVVRDIKRLVQMNNQTNLHNILIYPINEIPKNELGLVIKARNKMLLEMEYNHREAMKNKAAFEMVKLSNKVSHEILNPLTIILGNLDIISRDQKNTETDHKKPIEKIETQARLIQSTVVDLIKLSESILYQEIENFDFPKLLEEIIAQVQKDFDGKIIFDLKFEIKNAEVRMRKTALTYAIEALLLSTIESFDEKTEKKITVELSGIDKNEYKNYIKILIKDYGKNTFNEWTSKLVTNDTGRETGFKLYFGKAMIEVSGGIIETIRVKEENIINIELPCLNFRTS